MKLGCALFMLFLAVLLGVLVNDIRRTMRYDLQLKFHDGKCTRLETPTQCEDLTALGDGESAIAGCGDLRYTLYNGSATAKDGSVWLVNAKDGSLRQLEIEGPSAPRLNLHGIYYSQSSRRLYAVNHVEAAGESVEVFDVVGAGAELRLRHALTVRSPLFGNFVLNDVVEGEENEIYITEWKVFPFPAGGKAGEKYSSFADRMRTKMEVPLGLAKVPLTRVFRCSLAPEPHCDVATATRFVMANGIAVSDDRRSIFVNDAVARSIVVLEREPSGSLRKVSSFATKHPLDNIEMGPDGKLTGGSMPFVFTTGVVCEEARDLSASRVVDGREIGCGKSPGGLLRISLLGTGRHSFVDGTQSDHAVHDGSLLSGVSAALQLGEKVLLGSPESPGVLLCDV